MGFASKMQAPPNSNSTITECPRAPAGRMDEGWRMFLPRLFENGDYLLPSRYCGLEYIRVNKCSVIKMYRMHGNGRRNSASLKSFRERLSKYLMTNFQIGRKMSFVLAHRSLSDLQRISEEIKGLVDSWLLAFPKWFETAKGYKILVGVLRKVLKVATFNCDHVTKLWKNFTVFVYAKAVRLQTLQPAELSEGNFFKKLLGFSDLLNLIENGVGDGKEDLQSLAHLTSTRHLVAGGRPVLEKSLNDFFETISTKFEVSKENLQRIYQISKKIGKKCRRLGGSAPQDAGHISLSMAGSYSTTVKDGGRSADILSEIKPILTHVPLADEVITLPFIKLECPAGKPRWQYWCREVPVPADLHTGVVGEFGTLKRSVTLSEPDRLWGFDEAIGCQILCCAYFAMRDSQHLEHGIPIPVRVLSIPEPGGKSRIVTTTLWWNIILQQPLGHILKEYMLVHPSATSGLRRAEQAWEYLKLLIKSDRSVPYPVLSSDLKEATDAIPPDVAEQLLLGFCDGLKYWGHLAEISIKLIAWPRIVFSSNRYCFKERGIFMGEPLTKVVLHLFTLCCEEMAIRDYLGQPSKPIQATWRAFAVGGDDHIARGPIEYLNKITQYLLLYGAKLSPEKHGISSIAVRFCEKFLDVRRMSNQFKIIYVKREDYLVSPYVDSIKVRLLSPISKSIEVQNDRNIAIGKALSLSKTLRWLEEYYSTKWMYMVRDRFFNRMKSYLPSKGKIRSLILLPQNLGGLGLWLEQDLVSLGQSLPTAVRAIMNKILTGSGDYEDELRILKKFTRNLTVRGYDFKYVVYDFIESTISSFVTSYSIRDAINKNPGVQWTEGAGTFRVLNSLGYYTLDEATSLTLRGYLFKDIISGELPSRVYNTEPWNIRFERLWNEIYRGAVSADLPVFSPEDLKKIFKIASFTKMYHLGEEHSVSYMSKTLNRMVVLKKTFLEELQEELPNLRIPRDYVGLQHNVNI